jgi:hypothetical protein
MASIIGAALFGVVLAKLAAPWLSPCTMSSSGIQTTPSG